MPARPVRLCYGSVLEGRGKAKIDNVSAAAFGAGHLWTAADEGFSLERLKRHGDDFTDARSFGLSCFFADYPPPREDESDLEGLAFSDNRLWLTGSHARVRKKYEKRRLDELLADTEFVREVARTLLGSIEVAPDGMPVEGSGRHLPLGDAETGLIAAMSRDWPELRQAAMRPGKENGVDIEGIAVAQNRVFLGLRGPVLGPYATILEIEIRPNGPALEIIPVEERLTRPHLIDTGGLGIRDLAMHPQGLIVLAGPTLDMEGPFELYLARAPLDGWTTEPGSAREALFLEEIASDRRPDGKGRLRGDRPEAITLLDDGLLVISERKMPKGERAQTVLGAELRGLCIP